MHKLTTVIAASAVGSKNYEHRRPAFENLVRQCDAHNLRPIVSRDREMVNHYYGLRRAWRLAHMISEDTGYCLVLEEDAVLAGDFRRSIEAIIRQAETRVAPQGFTAIQLGVMGKGVAAKYASGNSWIDRHKFTWHWGVLVEAGELKKILEFDARWDREFKYMDDLFSFYATVHRKSVLVPLPNIVQHAAPERSSLSHPATIGGRERLSSVFAGLRAASDYSGPIARETNQWVPDWYPAYLQQNGQL